MNVTTKALPIFAVLLLSTSAIAANKAINKHPDLSGNWASQQADAVGKLLPTGDPRSRGWAPLSKGDPDTRPAPPEAEQRAAVLRAEEELRRVAALSIEERDKSSRRLGPLPAPTAAGQAAYIALNRDYDIARHQENCFAGNAVSGIMGSAITIAQLSKYMIIANDNGFARIVYLDGRDDSNAVPSMFGYSIGKWQGNSLVVTTTNISGKFIMAGLRSGWPMTENIVLTETFTLTNQGKTLRIKRVFSDPQYYSEPIGSLVVMDKTTDDLFMSACVEGLADLPYRDVVLDSKSK